jgi:hypothetical protein
MASQQRRRMRDTNANGYRDGNGDCNGNGDSDADANSNGYSNANTYGYSDADTHGDPASADAKAAAYAVAAPDAVSEWVKELQQK